LQLSFVATERSGSITAGAATSFIRDPDGNLISMITSAGTSYYYTTDRLGSVILLSGPGQDRSAVYTYDAWGNTTPRGTQATTNPRTYAGGYNDTASSRIKLGARYYNPYRGRFTQPDPSGQEQNRYLYAAANPCSNTDPTGLDWTLQSIIGCSVAVASLFGSAIAILASPFVGGLSLPWGFFFYGLAAAGVITSCSDWSAP
jgi:RHS repeat-associated protein